MLVINSLLNHPGRTLQSQHKYFCHISVNQPNIKLINCQVLKIKMVSVNISYDINCYINGNEKAIKNLKVKLEVKNQEKKIQYANEFVQLIKSILTSTYKSSSLQIHRGIVLLSNVIHYDNFVLLDLIKSELEGVIFDLRSYSRNYEYDTSTRTKIRADATLLWDLLNPPPTPDKLSTTSNSTRKCPTCKQTDLVVLPCSGKCCTYCLTAYVLDKIKNDLSVIRCPCTKSKPSSHNLEIPTIISLLDMESADKFLKRQTRHGRKFALVSCLNKYLWHLYLNFEYFRKIGEMHKM